MSRPPFCQCRLCISSLKGEAISDDHTRRLRLALSKSFSVCRVTRIVSPGKARSERTPNYASSHASGSVVKGDSPPSASWTPHPGRRVKGKARGLDAAPETIIASPPVILARISWRGRAPWGRVSLTTLFAASTAGDELTERFQAAGEPRVPCRGIAALIFCGC